MTDADRIASIRSQLPEQGFFRDKEWVLSPAALALPEKVVDQIVRLGPALRSFQQACNALYLEGCNGGDHAWVTALLDRGKPESIVELGRNAKWREELPRVIRPDLILGEDGVHIAELDSLPGGMGLTAWLCEIYGGFGESLLGGSAGMLEGFAKAFPEEQFLISRESADYEPEMNWLLHRLAESGRCNPRDVSRTWEMETAALPAGPVYRFFELWDLANVEHSGEMVSRALAGEVRFTPPLKAFMEEKLWLALFWSPELSEYWEATLSEGDRRLLEACIPQGWVVDPVALPPWASVPGLRIHEWTEVEAFGSRERELVLKVSGFSERSWGSRGVSVGHDLSTQDWSAAVREALGAFPTQPHLMQRFKHAKVHLHPAWDDAIGAARPEKVKTRLCPYYFVPQDAPPQLGGVLATICPADKKLLHGMRDAMMVPCSGSTETQERVPASERSLDF